MNICVAMPVYGDGDLLAYLRDNGPLVERKNKRWFLHICAGGEVSIGGGSGALSHRSTTSFETWMLTSTSDPASAKPFALDPKTWYSAPGRSAASRVVRTSTTWRASGLSGTSWAGWPL